MILFIENMIFIIQTAEPVMPAWNPPGQAANFALPNTYYNRSG